MSRKRVKKIRKAVFKVLENDEYARKNINHLIIQVAMMREPELAGSTFINFMKNTKMCMESITRAKRDFFSKHPELKTKEMEKACREEEKIYREEYSKHVPHVD